MFLSKNYFFMCAVERKILFWATHFCEIKSKKWFQGFFIFKKIKTVFSCVRLDFFIFKKIIIFEILNPVKKKTSGQKIVKFVCFVYKETKCQTKHHYSSQKIFVVSNQVQTDVSLERELILSYKKKFPIIF